MKYKILILGGTKMARLLAEHLGKSHNVIYSIAGTTKVALLPKQCQQVSGGFGGVAGLLAYIRKQNIELCIDATHPFAQNISRNAIAACAQANIPICQYARKIWQVEGANEFETINQLVAAVPDDAKILLTVGGQNILAFLKLNQAILARMIEPPKLDEKALPENFEILLSRPPYEFEAEMALMQKHKITHLICKNSGGDELASKLTAAQHLGVKIFMLAQPQSPHQIQYFKISEINNYVNNLSLVSPS